MSGHITYKTTIVDNCFICFSPRSKVSWNDGCQYGYTIEAPRFQLFWGLITLAEKHALIVGQLNLVVDRSMEFYDFLPRSIAKLFLELRYVEFPWEEIIHGCNRFFTKHKYLQQIVEVGIRQARNIERINAFNMLRHQPS